MICCGIMVMLAAVVAPTVDRVLEQSRSTVCQGHLHKLGQLLPTLSTDITQGRLALPETRAWTRNIYRQEMDQYLQCPSAFVSGMDPMVSLEDVYIRQDGGSMSVTPGVVITNLADAIFEGTTNDPQLHWQYQGQDNGPAEGGWKWVYDLNGGPPADNQAVVAIATCAAVLVTFQTGYVEFKPLGHSPFWNSGSQHWVGQGDPNDEDGWEGDVLVRLTGQGYPTVNPPVRIKGRGKTDYAMNSLVPMHRYSMEQLLLVEYNESAAWLDGPTPDMPFDESIDDGEVIARHLGKANFVRTDGSVGSMTKGELQAEYERTQNGQSSIWLP
jgi:hypothetical protein